MESIPNIKNPLKGSNVAKKFVSSKVSFAKLTIGPTTSPNPIHKKAKKIGNVFTFLLLII